MFDPSLLIDIIVLTLLLSLKKSLVVHQKESRTLDNAAKKNLPALRLHFLRLSNLMIANFWMEEPWIEQASEFAACISFLEMKLEGIIKRNTRSSCHHNFCRLTSIILDSIFEYDTQTNRILKLKALMLIWPAISVEDST